MLDDTSDEDEESEGANSVDHLSGENDFNWLSLDMTEISEALPRGCHSSERNKVDSNSS